MSQNWAICIGIDRYDNLQSLRYARRDAEAMRDFLHRDMAFANVYFLAEDAPEIETDFGEPIRSHPTVGTLRRFLRIRFEQKFLKPSDNLWFFFAGHGRRERDRDYLLPSDVDPGNVEETGIAVSYVTERLRRSGAENVILFLDACRNDGARDGLGIGAEVQSGVITVCACSPTERSYEIDELRHGVFTHSLLEALQLQGESNCATVERLDQQLRLRVPELCSRYNKPHQTPYTKAEPLEKRHLILLPKLAGPADLQPLRLDAFQAEAEGDLETAEQLWWRIIAAAPVDPQAHEAVKRVALKQKVHGAAKPAPSVQDDRSPSPAVWRLPISRRRLAGSAAVAAIAAGAVTGAPFVRRLFSKPPLRNIQFYVTTVDDKGAPYPQQAFSASVFTEPIGSGTGLDLVAIPGGSFTMGSPADEPQRRANEGPQHHVQIAPFFIGASPITQAQWSAVVMAHPAVVQHDLDPSPSFFRGIDLPVETITWNQAEEFCRRLSTISDRQYRLPTEAEWEYACRAGTSGPFHTGPTITPELANYCGTGGAVCGTSDGASIATDVYDGVKYASGAYGQGPIGIFRSTTTRSGTFPPNRFGLYDMHGNVWEFCLDKATDAAGGPFPPPYTEASRDGTAKLSGAGGYRMLRGGSWSHNPAICRSAYRDIIPENYGGWQGRIGFRVICTL